METPLENYKTQLPQFYKTMSNINIEILNDKQDTHSQFVTLDNIVNYIIDTRNTHIRREMNSISHRPICLIQYSIQVV